ncbi:MAG: replicative DNA helicase [Verrucomicrobia bacterium]|nr:replicative DNA helicase [Verrucomicrobiota bacterium]
MIDAISPDGGAASTDFRKTRRKKVSVDLSKIDRLPPHSLEAEQGVLGCLLLSPNDCIGECVQKFKSGAEIFYDLRHQSIYQMLIDMYEKKEAIDLITLQQRLKDRQQLEAVGGIAYVSALVDQVPSAANLKFYADIIYEKYVLRKMIQTCTNIVARAYEQEGEVDELLDEVERDVLKIVESRVQEDDKTMKSLVQGAINKIEEYFKNQGATTGIATGFADLDKMTSGLQPGDMVVIAARPSMGKTSLAMNIAEHVVIHDKTPVGVFSLEMTAQSLVLRMICSYSRVNFRDIRAGFLSDRDFPKLTDAASKLTNAPLVIDDTAGLSILQLRAKARRMHQQYGIKLIVIDYLQLLHSSAARAKENRQQEIADISSGIKALAKELHIPIIVLAQLNREMEKDKNRKPRMSDLRESGAIEQDADLIGMLYKPGSSDDEDGGSAESDAVAVNLLIAKQRNGPTGDVCLTFLKSYTRFENAAKVSPEDMPGD